MFEDSVTRLREIYSTAYKDSILKSLIESRDQVLAHYGPVFSPKNLPKLTASDFQSFLLFRNNRHWTGLHRKGNQICQNMKALRGGLLQLHDGARPIEERFDAALDQIKYIGKATLSAVLHVMYPDTYGVWNRTSEGALKILGDWPEVERGSSAGTRYRHVNDVLTKLKISLAIDLWTLDALFWRVTQEIEPGPPVEGASVDLEPEDVGESQKFGLEKYLHEFLRDNWERTQLGKNWRIYAEDGEDTGYKYQCGAIGQIDILARQKKGHSWLVVELKRDRTADAAVGQLLRYIGYVKQKLAKKNERIFGIIIGGSIDDKLRYAVSTLANVAVHTYSVEFKLESAKVTDEDGAAAP